MAHRCGRCRSAHRGGEGLGRRSAEIPRASIVPLRICADSSEACEIGVADTAFAKGALSNVSHRYFQSLDDALIEICRRAREEALDHGQELQPSASRPFGASFRFAKRATTKKKNVRPTRYIVICSSQLVHRSTPLQRPGRIFR